MFINIAASLLTFTAVAAFPGILNGRVSNVIILIHGTEHGLILQKSLPLLSSRDDVHLDAAPFANVYFIKERSVASHKIEVHALDAANNYAVPTAHYPTVFNENEWQNGKFEIVGGNMDAGDLFFIKLRNTGSGQIELHRATAATDYTTFGIQTPTVFDLSEAGTGTWSVDNGDLYLIKTKNTGFGRIEVHRASRSNYLAYSLIQITSLPSSEGSRGTWVVVGGNLYFIKYRNTNGQNVEVHRLSPGDGFQQVTSFTSWFNILDGDNGTWDIGTNGDLFFIKTQSTGSGMVEVHVATAASGYQAVSHYASWITQADGPNGEWCAQ